jgi:cardiolipin synthase (CMP-forming)
VTKWRIFTVPNAVSIVRLAGIPWFIILLRDDRVLAAAWLLAIIGWSDVLDGYLARRLNQVSELGAILDPVVDRAVFLGGVGAAVYFGYFPVWLAILILVREAGIALLMVGATLLGMQRFSVTKYGKYSAFALLWAVTWMIGGEAGGFWRILGVSGWIIVFPAIAFSYYTLLFEYVPLVRRHLKAGRAARSRLP